MLNYLKKINVFLLRNNVFNNVSFNINSLDNPGWVIRLDLSETNYESNKNILINKYNFGDDWIDCGFNKLNRKVIEGGGDPSKLSKILEYVFLAINDSNLNYVHSNELNEESEFDIIDWLEKWYISWCNNNYNYFNEDFDIDIKKEKGKDFWEVKLELTNTKLAGIKFKTYYPNIVCRNVKYFECESDGEFFRGKAFAEKIQDLLLYFKEWAQINGLNF